jgi:single-strand DNA-binding protein
MNRFVGVGRLTKDVELRYSASGVAVARFTIAINRPFKKDETDFINCLTFKKSAENLANYCKKGALIGIDGRIQTGSYEKDGKRIYTTEVLAESIQFLETRGTKQEADNTPSSNTVVHGGVEISDDELPF